MINSGVAENLHGAGTVPASFLEDAKTGGNTSSVSCCPSERDAEGDAIFNGLGAALSLVFSSVRCVAG
jgi:hypothetical protein